MQYLLNIYHSYHQEIIMLSIMVLLLILLVIFIKKVLFVPIKNYVTKYYPDYEKVLERYFVYNYLLHSLLSLYFIFWGNILEASIFTAYFIITIKNIVIILYTCITIIMLFSSIINVIHDIYQNKFVSSGKHPIALYLQILKMFIISFIIVITISKLLNISLGAFFTSLGAATALLTFIFKDTVLGLLASLQLTFQDIIRIGDWIALPKDNIEGTVEKITITVVRIRNADKTITTIPTNSLLTANIKNWRDVPRPDTK